MAARLRQGVGRNMIAPEAKSDGEIAADAVTMERFDKTVDQLSAVQLKAMLKLAGINNGM